ncbi:cytochrome P450 [Streptomyces spororaveus]|uniref:cytochrome P450 n=1 Tax=Streptomyces spororaveus TaxID=284039 RepID=UPI002079392E|nr:cytochrome P450 [Streptomyces spororaveus]MCM9078285.1 cytochrome P450 [Streptomyces spororaveus]
MSREVPLVAGHPLLGSLKELREDVLAAYLRAQRSVGDVVRFQAGPPGLRTEVYGVFSADGVQQVLGSQAANFRKDNPTYDEIRESVGNGLLTSQDDEYVFQRRMVQPLFTRRRVDEYATAVRAEAVRTVAGWKSSSDGVVDVSSEMTEFGLRAVARILFGADIDTAIDVIRRRFPVIGESVLRRGVSPVRLPRTWPTPANRRTIAAQRELYDVCDRIIAQRAADGEHDGDDMISLLVRARDEDGSGLTADAVRDQILIFLLVGHDTTATSLAFALHLLAGHPEARARARAEVDTVLAGRPVTAEDTEALTYLNQLLKETMRLYPAAPIIGRRAFADADVSGFRIPAGADVYLTPWVTHRHPDYWERPETFDPERFTPDQEAARPRYAWFPFGGGPRACIGQHFSMMEACVALATVLQRYDVEAYDPPGHTTPVTLGMALRPAGPLRVRVTARTTEAAA